MREADPLKNPILLVDDDPHILELIRFELEEEHLEVETAATGALALEFLAHRAPSVVVLDLQLPDISGNDVLRRIRDLYPELPVVILTARSGIEAAVECMRAGATDFIKKPFDRARLIKAVMNARTQGRLSEEVLALSSDLQPGGGFDSILGSSPSLLRAIALLRRAARTDVSVLIEGESGTGKEIAAQALHAESVRSAGPFIAINCGAIPESLIESELFGHEKGAFTGANALRRGCFEEAIGGTLFLDEVGVLKPDLQVRLLRVLETHCIQRVGSSKEIAVDVRIVAATNLNLRKEIATGRFRDDLFYRLSVFPVTLPPLRERGADLQLIAQRFIDIYATQYERSITGPSPATHACLEAYPWPGNVRELRNVIERAVILEDHGLLRAINLTPEVIAVVYPDGLPESELAFSCYEDESAASFAGAPDPNHERPSVSDDPSGAHLELLPAVQEAASMHSPLSLGASILSMDEYEKLIIEHALHTTGWCIKDTIEQLRIGRATLYRKIERYGLHRPGA